MTESDRPADPLFFQLILSLHAGAMQQLGKVASPLTGKVTRDLDQAKATIDLVEMLKRKTEGNLKDDERKVIEHVLFELRMNYVDEIKKGKDTPETQTGTQTGTQTETDSAQPNAEQDDNGNKG
jgi:hypothetical protein